MKTVIPILLTALAIGGAQAAVVVTDNGGTAPTLAANDTGYTGPTNSRFGWDAETVSQSFTLSTAGVIDSIYLAYNGFDDGDTLTITLTVNGGADYSETGIVLDGNNFSGDSGIDTNGSPTYWMQFDLSGENISLPAGSNSFTMAATANTGSSWALAPMYGLDNNPYAGGVMSGPNTGSDDDLSFAVTLVPEPSTFALLGLAGFALLRRRRS